ncbi:response regulator [Vibrio alginolyticus]
MFDVGIAGLLYPKAITLYITLATVLMWLLYYCHRLKDRKERVWGTHHAPYIAYTSCIIIWIGSNAYFHTDLLMILGSDNAVLMARLANLASFFSFAFAYYFSCQLLAEQNKIPVERWQNLIFILLSVYSLFINLRWGLTVANVVISAPSEFVIKFGSHTVYFFSAALILIVLTLINLFRMRANCSKLALAKNNYMIAGILVFMFSTTAVHLGLTYFFNDFSLTWLPPALSVSEMFFVGYALLTSRFYSLRYLIYLTLTALTTCAIYVVPLGALLIPVSSSNQWTVAMPVCLLVGVTWLWVFRRVSHLVSYCIYFHKYTPVQQILALENEFKTSIDDAMNKLAALLKIPKNQLQLVSSNNSECLYEDYLHSNETVLLVDELSEDLNYASESISSLRELYRQMCSNETALVIPLFGQSKDVSELLISSHKKDNQLFSNEEISALQKLMTLVQSTVEADRKISQRRALAHSIAHEMRNPLTQVQLLFEELAQHIDSGASLETLKRDLNKGQAAVQRGRQLIDIILREVSDTSPDQEPLAMTSVHSAVTHAVNRYGFENEKIIERIKLPQQQDFVANLNETLFSFVIFNLIRNAVYYFDSYPSSRIEITSKTGTYENCLIFRDTGPGIDTNILNKIFDDFFSYQKSGGTGLGLSYCQRVMRSFGGQIECQSVKGEFSEFYLYFPVVTNAPTVESLRSEDEAWHTPQVDISRMHARHEVLKVDTPTVLVVDDKEAQRTLVELYLKKLGVNSLQAKNGAAAIEIVKSHEIDLILMDIQMPVMNGFEASRRIRQIAPDTIIIAFSGESGSKELKQISTLMDDRLHKPTNLAALSNALDNWLYQDNRAPSESLQVGAN